MVEEEEEAVENRVRTLEEEVCHVLEVMEAMEAVVQEVVEVIVC